MPFTPFHWGPSYCIGLIFFRCLNFYALLLASVVVDIEPFIVLVFKVNYPLHGYLHTFTGGTVVALILAKLLYCFKGRMNRILGFLKVPQESSFKIILISCMVGVYFHIFLDSFLYADIKPFWPIDINPLYGKISFSFVYFLCGISFIFGVTRVQIMIEKA